MRKVLPFLLPPSGRARGRPKGQEQRSWTGRSHTHTENDGCSLASKEDVDGVICGSEPHSWVRTTLLLATTRHCSLQTTRYTAARMLGLILKSTHMLTRWHPTGRSQRERWLLFSVKGGCAQRYPTHHIGARLLAQPAGLHTGNRRDVMGIVGNGMVGDGNRRYTEGRKGSM